MEIFDLKDIADLISVSFIVLDSEKRLIYSNRSALIQLQKKYSDFEGKNFFHCWKDQVENWEGQLTELDTEKSVSIKMQNSNLILRVQKMKFPLKDDPGYFIEIINASGLDFQQERSSQFAGLLRKVSHEMSNPLSVLIFECESIQLKTEKGLVFSSDDIINNVKKMSRATHKIENERLKINKISDTLDSGEAASSELLSTDEKENKSH